MNVRINCFVNRKPKLVRFVGLPGAILMLLGALACGLLHKGPEQHYELKGKVVSVDKRGGTITVAHEAIPGYMEAMTMPFKLKDTRLLNDLAEGDRLQAMLVVSGARSWLEDVVVTREISDSFSKAENSIEPKSGDEVPDFSLINQEGRRTSFHKYRGRAVLLTFIYTRCPLPDYCPLITDNFSEIQKALKTEPDLYAKTHLLSVSVDPEYDTPRVLREYAAAHSADLAHWDFATGSKDEVKRIATYFGLQYWRDGDQVVHSLRTAIIGADGKFVKLYRGNEWKPSELVAELRGLGSSQEARANSSGYRGVGVVESTDPENLSIQIDHEDIKGLMPAMNMPYRVKDKSLLDSIAPGDKIDFWLESTPSGLVVIRLQKH